MYMIRFSHTSHCCIMEMIYYVKLNFFQVDASRNFMFFCCHNVTMKRPCKCELVDDILRSHHLLGGPHLNEHSNGLGKNPRQIYYYSNYNF